MAIFMGYLQRFSCAAWTAEAAFAQRAADPLTQKKPAFNDFSKT